MRRYGERDGSQKQTKKKTLAKTMAMLFCKHCGTAGHTQQGEQSDQTDFLTTQHLVCQKSNAISPPLGQIRLKMLL